MKIRNGFISNSSSSSFIIRDAYKDEILDYAKSKFVEKTLKTIAELKKYKSKYISNWQDVIIRLEKEITPDFLSKNIFCDEYKDYIKDEGNYDLSEYYDLREIKDTDLILYDIDDNILNRLADDIYEKFNVIHACEHM